MFNISQRTHGLIDYVVGILLAASPIIISYPDEVMKTISMVFGAGVLFYSAVTDYPPALLRFLPFPVHRAIDLLAGGALAFAPIHFGAHGLPAVLFVVTGLCLLTLGFFTRGPTDTVGNDNPLIPGT